MPDNNPPPIDRNGGTGSRSIPASEVAAGDSVQFLLGGLAFVREVTQFSDDFVLLRCEISICVDPDHYLNLFGPTPDSGEVEY